VLELIFYHFGCILCMINPFEMGFIDEPKLGALFITDTMIDIFFSIDIIVTFFVAYVDDKTQQIEDNLKHIVVR
jgi:hypothetical protein